MKSKAYSFYEDTDRQNIGYHIECLEKIGIKSELIKNISSKHKRNQDLLISPEYVEPYILECKYDTPKTGNVCLEIIGVSFRCLNEFKFDGRFSKFLPNEYLNKKLCLFIEEQINNGIARNESMGFCFDDTQSRRTYLSVIRPSSDKWYIFKKEPSKKFIIKNLRNYPLLITRTERDERIWGTVSILIPERHIERLKNEEKMIVASNKTFPISLKSIGVVIKEK